MLLQSKSAVVTGSNRGIGKAIVEAFARNGADVWACARQPDEGFEAFVGELGAETGRTVTPVYFDLGDPDAIKQAAKQITAEKKPIDIVVNNAGAIFTSAYLMTPEREIRRMLDVNFIAPMLLTQILARNMLRQKQGSIINLSSSAAIEGNEGRSAYAAAKSAMIAGTKVMARELGSANIRVNAIAPGLTDTDMMNESTPEEALNETVARTALRRVGRPSEIAGAALFLASDLSSYMTGQTLRVDGGM